MPHDLSYSVEERGIRTFERRSTNLRAGCDLAHQRRDITLEMIRIVLFVSARELTPVGWSRADFGQWPQVASAGALSVTCFRPAGVATGYCHTCAVLSGGSIECWKFFGETPISLPSVLASPAQICTVGPSRPSDDPEPIWSDPIRNLPTESRNRNLTLLFAKATFT